MPTPIRAVEPLTFMQLYVCSKANVQTKNLCYCINEVVKKVYIQIICWENQRVHHLIVEQVSESTNSPAVKKKGQKFCPNKTYLYLVP